MFQRIIEIEALEQEDKKTIVQLIDCLLRDAKAKDENRLFIYSASLISTSCSNIYLI